MEIHSYRKQNNLKSHQHQMNVQSYLNYSISNKEISSYKKTHEEMITF